jgi:hypothetical protein
MTTAQPSTNNGATHNARHAAQLRSDTDSTPKGDTDLAMEFLTWLAPGERVDLSTICPTTGAIANATFLTELPKQKEWMRKFIDRNQGKQNIYVTVNRVRSSAPAGEKPDNNDIEAFRAVVLDKDAGKLPGGDPSGQHFRAERERLSREFITALAKEPCPPSLLVDSGGGYQVWYKFAAAIPYIDGGGNVPGICRTLQARYGGDNVHAPSNLMRLPGTVNVLSKTKREQGREPAAVTVVQRSKRVYTLEELAAWAPPSGRLDGPRTEPVKRVADEDEWTREWCENYIRWQEPGSVITGTIDDTAYEVANLFLDHAAEHSTVIEYLTKWSDKCCDVPMQLSRIEHIANSADRYRKRDIGCQHWSVQVSGFEVVELEPLTLEQAAKILGVREAPADEEERKNSAPGLGVWDAGDDEALPPPRGWLLGHTFARKFMSSILADGGVGKTALRYAQALSLASGRMLTGEHVFQRARVLIVSLEDDADELRRRILAARLHHRIDRGALRGWLFLSAPGGAAGKLMSTDNKGRAVVGELAANIEAAIVQHNIDLVMLDPFVKAHSVEENKNSIIDDVAQVLTDLATEHNIAVDAPHHVSKGPADPGNANRSRGASAMVNAGRLVYTLTVMNSEEAKTFGVPEEERKSYVRVDSGKVNIAKGGGAARWFRLVGVRLGNKTPLYPNGDEVQTVEPWTPPSTWADLGTDRLNRILDAIDAGLPDGNRYTDGKAATTRAAWRVVVDEAPHKTEGQAREIIKTWVKNGVLFTDDCVDPVNRKTVRGLKVDPDKRPK